MKKNDSRQNFLQRAATCVLVIGSLALTGDGNAATATGTATAEVVESVSISISAPTDPPLSGTIFTIEVFMDSLSTSGPLLRFGSSPPPGVVVTVEGGAGVGGADGANSATITVTRNADGSLSVSGGSGLNFTVSLLGNVITIEYN